MQSTLNIGVTADRWHSVSQSIVPSRSHISITSLSILHLKNTRFVNTYFCFFFISERFYKIHCSRRGTEPREFCLISEPTSDPSLSRTNFNLDLFFLNQAILSSYIMHFSYMILHFQYEDLRDPSYSFIGPIKLTRKRDRISATIYYIEENVSILTFYNNVGHHG